MIYIEKVQGCAIAAEPLIFGKDTIYVHTNIHKIEKEDNNSELFEYTERQYTYEEYNNCQIEIMNLLAEDRVAQYKQSLLDKE